MWNGNLKDIRYDPRMVDHRLFVLEEQMKRRTWVQIVDFILETTIIVLLCWNLQ